MAERGDINRLEFFDQVKSEFEISPQDALKNLIALRDFVEEAEIGARRQAKEIGETAEFGERAAFQESCLYWGNRRTGREIHIHLTSTLLNHCIDAITDDLIEQADQNLAKPKPWEPARRIDRLRAWFKDFPWVAVILLLAGALEIGLIVWRRG